jgi:phospholipase/carboxylesterase
VTPLGLATGRDGFLYVPTSYNAAKPSPLLVTLHGATMNSRFGVNLWRDLADARGVVVLSPDSRDTTWDGIRGRFAADVEFLDQALTRAFQRCTIDASRVVLHGFSDGASYGLALALANGDLFKHAIASSPGFIPSSDSPNVGRAKIFISHGRQDQILPIESTSALLVPELRGRGFDVQYRQFDGGHRVPPEIAQAAMEWALGS